jgi:hypothetical protein
MPLMSSFQVVAKRAEYAQTKVGWRAEFRGPVLVSVEAADLESCRWALFNAVDAKVVEWLLTEPSTALQGDAQKPSRRRR